MTEQSQPVFALCCSCNHNSEINIPGSAAIATSSCPTCGGKIYGSRYTRIDIGLSEVCNLNCIMCRRPQESEYMRFDKVCRILREAKQIGVQTISFSGGEPFIHPEFRKILSKAIELSLQIELVTNGVLIRHDDILALEKLKCVTVSIDGPRQQHDFIRGKEGAWDATMNTLRLLAKSRAKWGTNTVMQRANADHLLETWKQIVTHGLPAYVAYSHVEVVPETQHLQMMDEQWPTAKAQLMDIRTECKRLGVHFNDGRMTCESFDVFADKSRRYRPLQGCVIPQSFLGVTNYGVFPCWHQGRAIVADGLIDALEADLCQDIIDEALARRCVGCNAANYSWNKEWVDGIIAAAELNDHETGVTYLSEEERELGRLRDGKRSLPIIERERRTK